MADFDGKRGLVLGVANKRSIAWAIAKRLADGGAPLAFTYQGERIERASASSPTRVEPARHGVRRALGRGRRPRFRRGRRGFRRRARPARALGRVRGGEDLEGRFTDTPRDRFWLALDVSAYSLVACARAAEPLMEARGGGSILTMTYLGGERAVPHYNVMGVAKAALDASVRYLAWDLGQKNIRVNAVSAGPCGRSRRARSRASRRWRRSSRSARRSTATIDADDVGAAAAYLLSDEAANVTATTLYVDSGYHSMGM